MIRIEGLRKTFNPDSVNAWIDANGIDLNIADGDFVTAIGSLVVALGIPNTGAKLFRSRSST